MAIICSLSSRPLALPSKLFFLSLATLGVARALAIFSPSSVGVFGTLPFFLASALSRSVFRSVESFTVWVPTEGLDGNVLGVEPGDLEGTGAVEAECTTVLTLASCASFRCCQMFTEGKGAAVNDRTFSLSSPLSFSLSLGVVPFSPTLSALFDAWECLSQVESDEAIGVGLESSSFGNVEVEAVPKLGDDGVEVGFCVGGWG